MDAVGNADFVGLAYALKEIGSFAKDGWTAIVPEIQYLINSVVRLSLVLTLLAWIMKGSPDTVAEFVWVVVKLNIVLWFINDFWDITKMIFDGMVAMGVAAAPSVEKIATTATIKDPSKIVGLASAAMTPLMKHIDTMLGPVDTFLYMTELIFAYCALGVAIAVFIVFALLMFLAQAEFYIVAIPAAFMAPWLAWNKTAFIATPAIAYIVNSGIRLLGTTVVIVMGLSIMLAYKWPEESTVQDSINILVLTIAILGAALSVFRKLTGLVTGGPTADVGSALGALYSAARLGSAAGKEVQEVAGGLASGRGVLPRAASGFVNGVRGAPGSGGPGGTSGAPGAANNNVGGLRGAFQRGIAGARANVAAGAQADRSGSRSSSWFEGPTEKQQYLAQKAGVDLSGLNRAQTTVALEEAGVGRRLNTGSASGIAAAAVGSGTQRTSPGHAAGPSQSSYSPQAATAATGAPHAPSSTAGGQTTPQTTPEASGGVLGAYKQDMRDQQAHYAAMAKDPAVGSNVAESLRRDANRGTSYQAAEHASITDPAKGQAMFDQINRVDAKVDRAVAAGRPADVINTKSADDYRDIVLNA